MTAPKLASAVVIDAALRHVRVDFDMPVAQDSVFYDTANWQLSDNSVSSVSSSLGSSAALLILDEEMSTGATYTLHVENVTNEIAEVIDPSFDDVDFAGVGVHPTVVSASATGAMTVTVTISESVQTTAAGSPNNYSVRSPIGASQVLVTGVTYPGATTITLHLNREMTNGAGYELTVSDVALVDSYENGMLEDAIIPFTGLGVAPEVSGAELDSAGFLVVTFDEDMYDETALVSRLNYIIVCNTSGAAAAFVKSVKRVSATQVRLEISETTTGASYTVACGNVRDVYFNPINLAANDANFTGAGTTPRITLVKAVGPNRVDVVFSEAMLDTADLRDVSRYAFSGGLSVISAMPDRSDPRVVQLVTSEWVANVEYTLTITTT